MDKKKLIGIVIGGMIFVVLIVWWLSFFQKNSGVRIVNKHGKIEVGINGDNFVCEASICEFKLNSGEYKIEVEKEGFIGVSNFVKVDAGSFVEYEPTLLAVIDGMSEWKTVEDKLAEIPVEAVESGMYARVGENIFWLKIDTDGKQKFVRKKTGSQNEEIIAIFPRRINNGKIAVSVGEKFAVVSDENEDKSALVYLMDLVKSNRRVIAQVFDLKRMIAINELEFALEYGESGEFLIVGGEEIKEIRNIALIGKKFVADENYFYVGDENKLFGIGKNDGVVVEILQSDLVIDEVEWVDIKGREIKLRSSNKEKIVKI